MAIKGDIHGKANKEIYLRCLTGMSINFTLIIFIGEKAGKSINLIIKFNLFNKFIIIINLFK